MRFLHCLAASSVAAVLCLGISVQAVAEEPSLSALQGLELRHLLNPTPAEVEAERQGKIYIYDGLTSDQVDEALDTNFDRIQHMMFVRIRHPAPGAPQGYVVDDDGCD